MKSRFKLPDHRIKSKKCLQGKEVLVREGLRANWLNGQLTMVAEFSELANCQLSIFHCQLIIPSLSPLPFS